MKSRLCLVGAALALVVVVAAPALGIVGGQPDGTGHPSVGALDLRPMGFVVPCSGTLVSPTVYVTAGHCTNFLESHGITQAKVTFDPVFADSDTFYTGTVHTDPAFATGSAADPGDLGVVVFDSPVTGITPAVLPSAGLLDQLGPQGLRNQPFTEVGYGVSRLITGGGPPDIDRSSAGTRRVASEAFDSLAPAILRLSVTNDGKPCTGDSGAPQFLGTSNTIAAVDFTGDHACTAMVGGYRLDTPAARAFLANYVTLP